MTVGHQQTEPNVCLIIVNWNGLHHLEECLGSLRRVDYNNFVTLFIDNNSSDHSVRFVEQKFPECTIIQNETNLGCGGGRNVGLRWALERGFDYVGFLDNDMRVAPTYLGLLVNYLEQEPDFAGAMARINYYDAPHRVQSMGMRVNLWLWQTLDYMQGAPEKQVGDMEPFTVDALAGGASVVRRSAIRKVGLLDEGLWRSEDVDWSLRLREQGYKLACVPGAVVWHKGSRVTLRHGFAWWSFHKGWTLLRKHGASRHWLAMPLGLLFQLGKVIARPVWEWAVARRVGARVFKRDEAAYRKE